ncbi:MAG TPA: TetM/TetW/TetO/TetS family tetracycline resistance ribosomal protection protein [Oceanospirillales bacterium]|nr:TetM/TetW/TetO/TetS family tetracycline resistance ribosomal protection protein [Oceanospirillales bacterium]
MQQTIINIGILAHVDAGKTTITEQMLYQAGATRQLGSVDKGTSATDHLKVERDRGISVRLATASFVYKETKINLIDTPGHVDFCAEVEYSLRAMDAVILVISAVEGVQGHTITLYKAIKQLQIPCVIFINKIDRMGADVEAVMIELARILAVKTVVMQQLSDQGSNNACIQNSWGTDSINEQYNNANIESVIEYDDALMEAYLAEENLDFQQLDNCLKKAVSSCHLLPVVFGVAKNGLGIKPLLDVIINYLPAATGQSQQPLAALVFKIEHDKTLGKMAYIRVFNGTIQARDEIHNSHLNNNKTQKVGQIKTISKGKYVDVKGIAAGDIGIVSGLDQAQIGDIYGDNTAIPKAYRLSATTLTVQVKPNNQAQIMELVQALKQLSTEDPLLAVQWLAEIREIHLKITGLIQIEILQAVLQDRFGLATEFSQPSIIYRETPAKVGHGYERYWMPKPCWAIVKFKIEPAQAGSGVSYHSQLGVNEIAAKYQKEIEQAIPQALAQGIKGWQVTDVKITLVAGEDHNVHSRSGDFSTATPMAIMNGLQQTDTQLLEPIWAFIISAPLALLATVTSDIIKMRGSYQSPQIHADDFILEGKVPAATAMRYPITLASLSAGKAKFTSTLHAYEPCANEHGKTTRYKGISPLDRDKWILKARGAL